MFIIKKNNDKELKSVVLNSKFLTRKKERKGNFFLGQEAQYFM